MARGIYIALFVLAFFAIFALFQFDAESRRRYSETQAKLQELDLKLSTYISGAENDPARQQLSNMQSSQENLSEEYKTNKQTIAELFDLLISKDEKLARDIKILRADVEALKKQSDL